MLAAAGATPASRASCGVRNFGLQFPAMQLRGWKEIATHLRCGIRTAQRWANWGIPVRRLGRGPKAPVAADSEVLDARVKYGGKTRLNEMDMDAVISKSRKLLAEIQEARRSLREGVRTIKNGNWGYLATLTSFVPGTTSVTVSLTIGVQSGSATVIAHSID